MNFGNEIKVVFLVHTPMQLVSGFSLVTQLGFNKNEVFVGLVTRRNKEVVSFMNQVLTIDKISHEEVFNIDGFLSANFFVLDYLKYFLKIIKFIKFFKKGEILLLPDRAHPFYRFVAVIFTAFLKIDKNVIFCEEGASHYYNHFEKIYVSKCDLLGKMIGNRFINLYEKERIIHFSIRKFDAFDKDRKHEFYLYPFQRLVELSEDFHQKQLHYTTDQLVFIIPTSMRYFEGVDLGIPLYDLWLEKLEKFNPKAKILIKPHPMMEIEHLNEICGYFESHGKSIESTSNIFKFIPIEFLLGKIPENSLLLGYDTSSICIFGPNLFGAHFEYVNVVNEVLDRDCKTVVKINERKSDYYLDSMNLMKLLDNDGN
jgi:hypothetical protein